MAIALLRFPGEVFGGGEQRGTIGDGNHRFLGLETISDRSTRPMITRADRQHLLTGHKQNPVLQLIFIQGIGIEIEFIMFRKEKPCFQSFWIQAQMNQDFSLKCILGEFFGLGNGWLGFRIF